MDMDKTSFLQSVTQAARERVATLSEVQTAYHRGSNPLEASSSKHISIVELLYYLGGTIVVLGIVVLVGQRWGTFNSVTQLLVTLGSGIAAYLVAVLLLTDKRLPGVAQAFFLISALVIPVGLHVAFKQGGYDIGQPGVQTAISGIVLVVFLLSLWVWRTTLFTLFSIIFGTWFFFALTNALVDTTAAIDRLQFYEYRALAVGLVYVLLGYAFRDQKYKELTKWLYSVGVLVFLGAALALGGYTPNSSLGWEAIFPGLVLIVIFLSVYLRSRSFLIFGALYLIAYIFKITAEYFADSVGWPLALVVIGFLLMIIGYGTFYLNRRYVSQKQVV